MIYLVSACLLGENCKYSGGNNRNQRVIDFCCGVEEGNGCVIPVCPELMGGLEAPRPPCEIEGGDGSDVLAGRANVWNTEGENLTVPFLSGAKKVLELALSTSEREALELYGSIDTDENAASGQSDRPEVNGDGSGKKEVVAILKAKSPSCGVGKIYDGTFSHIIREGDGVTTALLRQNGIRVCTEDEL